MEENLKVSVVGRFKLVCDQTGEVVLDQDNLVVSVGKDWIAGMMTGSGVPMKAIAAGTGTSATAIGDTALQSEIDRVSLTVSGGSASGNQITYTATFGLNDAVGALTEFGLFDSTTADSGTMLCRTVEGVVNKPDTMSYTASWVVTLPY